MVKKKKRVDMDVRPAPILFKNYDYTDEGPNETSPGGGLYHGSMGKYKSVTDFLKKKRRKRKADWDIIMVLVKEG